MNYEGEKRCDLRRQQKMEDCSADERLKKRDGDYRRYREYACTENSSRYIILHPTNCPLLASRRSSAAAEASDGSSSKRQSAGKQRCSDLRKVESAFKLQFHTKIHRPISNFAKRCAASHVNKDLSLKAKAKAKDSRYQGQNFHRSSPYIIFHR